MAKRPLPTANELRQLLRYEPETGELFWLNRVPEQFKGDEGKRKHLCRTWNARYGLNKAHHTDNEGYIRVNVCGALRLAHRVIWCIVMGDWPEGDIDHIDGRRDNNRIENLRVVSNAQNHRNRKLSAANSSGVMGVHWHKQRRKWAASVKINGKATWLGLFDDLKEAEMSVRSFRALTGEFGPSHGVSGQEHLTMSESR